MKSIDKLKKAADKIKSIKEEVLKDVLEDDSLSKLEKLKAISENGLWPVSDWIGSLFEEWEKECCENEKKAAIADGKIEGKDYICTITDDYFVLTEFFEDRHQTVHYINAIERLLDKDDEIVVVINRGTYKSVVKKTPQEIVDRVCDYCFENKVIGCIVDW